MVDSPTNNINIQLGDIIELIAPEDPKLNLQQFYIDYIDSNKIKIINIENNESFTIDINNGQLVNSDITQINLLSRSDTSSYAKQNNLVPGVWIEITFTTDDGPFNIKGIINNLEEDSIEIKTYPDDDTIFIDFAYQGIPEDLSIEKITIIKNPEQPDDLPQLSETSKISDIEPILPDSTVDLIDTQAPTPPSSNIIESQIEQALLEGDQIILGEDLEEIDILVDVPESEKRYSIDQQTDDLLDELLSTIPTNKRTNKVLNNIHTQIERFLQLRSEYSFYDQNGNLQPVPPITENTKPLANHLADLKNTPYWLLPIVFNRKKLYDVDEAAIAELTTTSIIKMNFAEVFTSEEQDRLNFIQGYSSDENKYLLYAKELNELYTPFTTPINNTNSIISKNVTNNILTIVNNLGEMESIVAGKTNEELSRKKYLMETYNIGLNYLKDKQLTPLTDSDNITIKAIAILELPFLLFNKINLPSTNILNKCLLSEQYLPYWNYLTPNKLIDQTITIDSFDDDDYEFNKLHNKMFSKLQEYSLDEELYSDPTNNSTYQKFLNKVIPSTNKLLNMLKLIDKSSTSPYKFSQYLQLFNIYENDINFIAQNQIINFTLENIAKYKTTLATNIANLSKFLSKNFTKQTNTPWLTILSQHTVIYKIIIDSYGIDESKVYSNTEFFDIISNIDYGYLFTLALIRIDLDLQTTGIIQDFVRQYQESINSKAKLENTCQIIVKKYTSLEDLTNDNQIEITADKEFDNTDYKFSDKFKSQKESMDEKEYKEFIKTKLLEKKNLIPSESEREADAILLNKRIVKDGDYAILEIPNDSIKYYIRKDNAWEDVTDKISNVKIKNNKLFCNLQENCITQDNNCTTTEIAESNINEQILKEVYDEFDKTYEAKSNTVREKIDLIHN